MSKRSLISRLPQGKWWVVGATLFALTGCQSGPEKAAGIPVEQAVANCSVEKVQHYLGGLFNAGMEEQIRIEADADEVRVLDVSAHETKDYRHERLNIRVDKNNRIFSMSCG